MISFLPTVLVMVTIGVSAASPAVSQPDASRQRLAMTRLEDVDEDFGFQGEYSGVVADQAGRLRHFGMQVAAHGDGQFVGLGYRGGLPGNGWDKQPASQWQVAT